MSIRDFGLDHSIVTNNWTHGSS